MVTGKFVFLLLKRLSLCSSKQSIAINICRRVSFTGTSYVEAVFLYICNKLCSHLIFAIKQHSNVSLGATGTNSFDGALKIMK